ncbi:MAG TPA: nucleotidyltransferase [Actinomycetota bacterium]|nr:nucleotidyltransferase [Actinomycetota bacterium]
MRTIAQILEAARKLVEVTREELQEARRRRGLVRDALQREFPGCRVYFNGSVAHGDAINPLADFDIGVVIPDPDDDYGPGRRSASGLKERAREAIRSALCDEFPDLRIEIEGRKRSVLIRFSRAIAANASDFTGDLICAVDHPEKGLYIPRFDSWDRSDPETHTRLVLDAIERTATVYAKTIRLLKHWNSHHGAAFCSWHLKVLAFEAITQPVPLIEALRLFFTTSRSALLDGPTVDPAGVGPEIKTNTSVSEAISKLETGLGHVNRAIEAEEAGRPLRAQAELAALLPEIVDAPAASELADEDRRFEIDKLKKGSLAGVGAGSSVAIPRSRAWGGRRN